MNGDACSHYKNRQRFPGPRSVILREREAAPPAYDSGAKHPLLLDSAESESLQMVAANIAGKMDPGRVRAISATDSPIFRLQGLTEWRGSCPHPARS